MYEYKAFSSLVRDCEGKFNELGNDGWRLVRTHPDLVKGGFTAIFGREIRQ